MLSGDGGGAGGEGKAERVRERGARIYPDEALIDPYDPSTFGFVFVGTVLGAHGLSGELKVRAVSDFAQERRDTLGRDPTVERDVVLVEQSRSQLTSLALRVAVVSFRDPRRASRLGADVASVDHVLTLTRG